MSAPGVSAGKLYVVSTPIGNLGDFTYRAVETLRAASLVVAEDTRHTRTLLAHYDIRGKLSSYHEHNEARETPRIVARILDGESVALVSDAGTPLLSDPGARLVRAAIDAGIDVVPIPGASALLAALVASGLDATAFTYLGFLPRKGAARADALASIVTSRVTTAIYESPQRIAETLRDLAAAGCAQRDAVVGRELTKRYEELMRGTIEELATRLEHTRGEIVLLVSAAPETGTSAEDADRIVAELRDTGATPRDIARALVAAGVPRNTAYRMAHGGTGGEGD